MIPATISVAQTGAVNHINARIHAHNPPICISVSSSKILIQRKTPIKKVSIWINREKRLALYHFLKYFCPETSTSLPYISSTCLISTREIRYNTKRENQKRRVFAKISISKKRVATYIELSTNKTMYINISCLR
jgi:hypothetical protein